MSIQIHNVKIIYNIQSTSSASVSSPNFYCNVLKYKIYVCIIVKLRRGSGKDRQGMAPKAKGLKA